ncbi:ankyrin, partial [Peniophora sp. CONT]
MLERSRQGQCTPADALITTRNSFGETALYSAIQGGKVDICRLLLEHGALVDDADNDGNTPLHIAASFRDQETVHLLLQHPA